VWRQDESGRVHTPLEPIVLAATLALIPILLIEADAESDTWQTIAGAANWAIWVIFAAELALILAVAERRLAALRAHLLDVALVIVTAPLFGEFLASLRLLRLARLLRLLRASVILTRALQAERRLTSGQSFRFIAVLTIFLVVIAGAAQAAVNADEFESVWDGVWWAVVTVTTVGYGDLYPRDVEGRLIGIALMLLGIGFLSVLTATIASRFIQTDTSDESQEMLATLRRIEVELAELKAQLAKPHSVPADATVHGPGA
jgi:voltage-gated potassium channel